MQHIGNHVSVIDCTHRHVSEMVSNFTMRPVYVYLHLQEHIESAEEQLAHTMAELAQLRVREHQLHAKNQLLEKVLLLNDMQRSTHASAPVSNCPAQSATSENNKLAKGQKCFRRKHVDETKCRGGL